MKIQSIQIKNLFDIFDYDIAFKPKENVLIITGPNGFGKTTVLNILYSLAIRNWDFFHDLQFEEINIIFEDTTEISIKRSIAENHVSSSIELSIRDLKGVISTSVKSFEGLNKFLAPLRIYLIREQRLFTQEQQIYISTAVENKPVYLHKEGEATPTYIRNANEAPPPSQESIRVFANELKIIIGTFQEESFSRSQEMDRSYPKRLISEKKALTQKDYEIRYKNIEVKQKKLSDFDLYEDVPELITYNDDDAKALTVYLKDLEHKLEVFDPLLEKLDLFTSILNERRFTFKSIKISRKEGFYFETSKGKKLELNQLSSGEQHEVVLLYELIFKTQPGVLVLIDEPEISLHITWQKEFLSDLLKIIKIQNIQVLIATHSPSIINDRWDLVYNLEATKPQ